jgi:GNAT superfamily N-acetyltransferase
VPPPPDDAEISTFRSENGEIYALQSEYVRALEELAASRENIIEQTVDLPLEDGSRGRQRDRLRIYEVQGSGPVIEDFYQQVLQPSFPADVLIGLDELQEIANRDSGSVWLAQDADGTILGGAVGEWDESVRVVLLGYLAVRPGIRGGGIGGPLFLAALDSWRQKFRPCLVLAEIEDPAVPVHSGSEDHGDAGARLRFYLSRGSRVLDIPYFQPALEPGADRVSGLLLIVSHADPDFAGPEEGTIDPEVVRRYLEHYQIQYEGKVATDEQAMEMWRALDRPGAVRLREH